MAAFRRQFLQGSLHAARAEDPRSGRAFARQSPSIRRSSTGGSAQSRRRASAGSAVSQSAPPGRSARMSLPSQPPPPRPTTPSGAAHEAVLSTDPAPMTAFKSKVDLIIDTFSAQHDANGYLTCWPARPAAGSRRVQCREGARKLPGTDSGGIAEARGCRISAPGTASPRRGSARPSSGWRRTASASASSSARRRWLELAPPAATGQAAGRRYRPPLSLACGARPRAPRQALRAVRRYRQAGPIAAGNRRTDAFTWPRRTGAPLAEPVKARSAGGGRPDPAPSRTAARRAAPAPPRSAGR